MKSNVNSMLKYVWIAFTNNTGFFDGVSKMSSKMSLLSK